VSSTYDNTFKANYKVGRRLRRVVVKCMMIVQTSRYHAVKLIHLVTSELTSASTRQQVAPPVVWVSPRRKRRDLKTEKVVWHQSRDVRNNNGYW